MTDRIKLAIFFTVCVICFVAGRESASRKTVTEEKIVYRKAVQTHEKRNVYTIKHKNGDEETLDTSTLDSILQASMDTVKKTEPVKSSILIQGMAGIGKSGVIYGAQVSRDLIGPVTIGVWGFSDLRFGLSLGLKL